MKILISGYYGFGNVGDEAVLAAIIKEFRKRDPQMAITVLSSAPALTSELNQVSSLRRSDMRQIIKALWKADVFLSGGGTLFQNVTSRKSLWYYLSLVFLAKLLAKKAVIFAQGFGPLYGRFDRQLARLVLNLANLITLRDSDSAQAIRASGVSRPPIFVTADPSHLLEIPPASLGRRILSLEAVPANKPLFGISVRSIVGKKTIEAAFFKKIAEVIEHLVRKYDLHPVFLPFQCPEDMEQITKITTFLKVNSSIIFRMCRPEEMLSIISQLKLLLGMRLHSLIFATVAQVPMIGLSYDPKIAAFMKEIDQPFFNVDQELDFSKLERELEKAVTFAEQTKLALRGKSEQLRVQAKRNFDLFFEYFKRGGKGV